MRESLMWVVQELMEAEVSELVGAASGERVQRPLPPRSLGHARREQQPMLAALIRPIVTAADGGHAQAQVTAALERLEGPLPRSTSCSGKPKTTSSPSTASPPTTAQSSGRLDTNPLEQVDRQIGRRTDVVGIFPNDRSLIRLAASVVIEENDEWLVGKRYLSQDRLDTILTDYKEDNYREGARQLTAA